MSRSRDSDRCPPSFAVRVYCKSDFAKDLEVALPTAQPSPVVKDVEVEPCAGGVEAPALVMECNSIDLLDRFLYTP